MSKKCSGNDLLWTGRIEINVFQISSQILVSFYIRWTSWKHWMNPSLLISSMKASFSYQLKRSFEENFFFFSRINQGIIPSKLIKKSNEQFDLNILMIIICCSLMFKSFSMDFDRIRLKNDCFIEDKGRVLRKWNVQFIELNI